jgi:hypothetical protein
MEQQHRANGRHRVLYEPRKDPVVQQHALELGRHCAGVVLQGVAAVSPNQQDPDGHRVLVASELTKAMLAEVYRMVGAVTGWAVEQQLQAFGQVVGAAAGTVAPAQRVVQAQPRSVRRASQAVRTAARQQVPRRIIVNRRGF